MSDDFRIKLSTELDSDVGKNTQKQLDKIDNLSVKIEKAQLTKEAIASIKKQIEDIQVQLSVGSTPSGGSGGGSGGGSNSGGGTRSRTPSSSTTNFTKLKADVDALISSLNNFSAKHTGFANFKKEIDGVEVSLDSLIKGLNEVGNSKDLAELRSQATALRTAFSGIYDKSVENVSVARINSLSNRIQEFMTKNTAITKSAKAELEGYLRELDGGNISVQKWNQINNALSKTQNQMRTLGKLGKSFSDQFKDAAGQFTQWISITSLIMGTVHQFTQSIGELKEIDDILTEISKTSDMTKQELQELGSTSFASASELGKTATDYLTSVQEMSRSGFYGEQGEEMAKTSLLAQAAGDMTADLANSYLLATNAAYKYEGNAEKLNAVLDGQNSITNRNSVSMVDMAEAMSEAGTVAANYRVSIEDLSAMIGTMEAVTKSGGSEVGNAIKSILINLQNITSSKIVDTLDAANASMTEMVDGVEQLRDPISILRDLAATFTQLDEADPLRAEILTVIGGKYQANKLSALLSNMDMFDKMLVDYSEGSGSAMVEAQKSADNWSGSLNKLSNTWTSIVNNFVNSDDMISAINTANSALETLDKLTKNIDITSLSTLGTILGGVLGAKNAGIFKVSNDGKLNLFGKNISDLINSITDLSDAFKDEGVSSLKAFKDAMDKAGASAKANQLVMKGLSVALNSLTYAAILKVIDLVITAFDNFIHRVEHAQEALENANSTYESTQSELSSITSELEEQEKVLSDLQSKEKLTYAEQGQLEELQQITAELQLQQDILEKQASREREDVANAAVKAFNTQYGKANLTDVDENQDRFWTLDSTDANIADVISDYLFAQKQLDNVKKQIQESERELSDSELEYLEYQFQHFTDLIDEYEYGLESHLATLEDYKQSLAESYNENILKQQNSETLTTNQQDVINTYQAIADAMRLIYQYTDPNQWNSMQISDVFATEGIEKTKDELIEMAKAGELTPETISGYKNLNSAIQQSGLFLEDGQTAAEAFVNEIYAAAEAEKKLNDGASEVANTTATISSSVSQIATQLKPQFDELAEAYKEIFSDDGFSIDVVDNEMLENLRSAFEDIEEDVGVSFDTTELNKFFSVLTDGASTADEVQQAFNDLATAYLYSTDTMENLNDETAAAIEQQLQEMGVTNANEVVSAALAQQKLNLGVANLYAAQTGGSLATATAEEIVNFAAEQIEMGNLSQEMAQLLLQKASLNLTTIDTEADINNLIALAETAGATAQTLNVLNAAKGRFGSTNSDSLDALRARKDLALGINNAPELNFDYEPVKLDFDGAYAGSKDAAGKAGKEAADEYKEQFEKELDDLQSLHDRGKITEKEYLDALRALYEKYFKDREKYLDEYQKYEKEYLDGMKDLYESVMSGIISRIDDHIDALNDQKDAAIDALEAQKDAALSAIEAERDARKENLEEQKQQLQDQIDLIQSQINAKQEEIDAINDAADATKRQADLEKALYEQKRAQEQRVNKVYSGQDRGFIYEADTSSIREADEAVEDAQREIRIANIEQEIKVLEKRRDALEDQKDLISQQLDELDEYYDKLISNTEAYYDNLIASTEAAWDEIIKGFEETKSRWEELQELEEQAEFDRNLRELGTSMEEVLNMSNDEFEAFKRNYLNILSDIYSGNDQMISSMSDLANVDMSALPGYLEETQQYIDMLSNGIDFTNLNDSLSSTITGFEDAAKAAGILTGAITGGGGSSSEGDKGKEGEGSSGESDSSGSSGSGDSLLGATETLKTTGVENITEFGNAFSSGEDEEGGESVAGKVMKATASIVGATGGGGSGKGKGKGSGEGSTEGGADSLMGGVALQTEAALDEEAGIPAQISKWEELNEVLDSVITKLDTIKEKLEGLSEIDFSIPGLFGGTGHFEGTVGNSYSSGTPGTQGIPSREHNAMISEFGPEIAVYPNGTYKLFTKPSIVDLPQGTAIFNTKQTLDILKGEKHISLGSAHFDGYDPETLEHMRTAVTARTLDKFNLGTLGDYEVAGTNNSNTVVNLNGGIVLEGVQDVDALAKGIVQKLPLKMMQIMNRKEYRPRR